MSISKNHSPQGSENGSETPNSNEDFVSKVHIDSWKKATDGIFRFTVFLVECELVTKKRWKVGKRYRQFLELHQKLVKKIPEVSAFLFPEKTILNCAKSVIYYRAYLFEDYLNEVLAMMPRPEEVDEFLEVPVHLQELKSGNPTAPISTRPSPRDFHLIKVIGQGAFGVVFLVRPAYSKDNSLYAMKVLNKSEIRRKGQIEHTKSEQKILEKVKHPFIIRLHSAFQSPDKLYMVMEFCEGGELYRYLKHVHRLPELSMKFYSLELILVLEFLHSNRIIFRDLKPENILLKADGHIKVADFGLAKKFPDSMPPEDMRASTFCGTPEYLAPEMLMNKLFQIQYGSSVDWWTLGVVCFELVVGRPPFKDKDFSKLCRKILKRPIHFPRDLTLSSNALSFIESLLRKNAKNRCMCAIPAPTTDNLKGHPFISDVDWAEVEEGKLSPPYIPANTASESGRSHLSEIVSTTQTPHHHHREEEDLDKYVDFNYLRDAKSHPTAANKLQDWSAYQRICSEQSCLKNSKGLPSTANSNVLSSNACNGNLTEENVCTQKVEMVKLPLFSNIQEHWSRQSSDLDIELST